VMAALRNTPIGLLRWAGYSNIAAACRRVAAQPDLALTLIGIKAPFKFHLTVSRTPLVMVG
jgi:hypothetical protein